MVGRGRGLCSLAVSATLLGVPVFAVPGPGHGHGPARGSPVAAQHTPAPAPARARAGATSYSHGAWTPPGHDHGHGPPSNQTASRPAPPPAPPAPPAVGHHRNVPPPANPPATQTAPATQTTTTTRTPNSASSHGNASGSSAGSDFPAQGRGHAHGSAHANSNSGGPPASRQGPPGRVTAPCGGLCHGGLNPGLNPATALAMAPVAVAATPTPVTVTPTSSTPAVTPPSTTSTPPKVSIPTLLGVASAGSSAPGFSSRSSLNLLGLLAPAGGGGGRFALAPGLIAGPGGLIGDPGGLIAGPGGLAIFAAIAPDGGGLGTSAPATGALRFVSAAVAAAPGASTGIGTTGTGTSTPTDDGGSSRGGGRSLFIPRFITHIPEGVWIALAAAVALAAVGGGAAVAARRRANAQAGELAAVAAVALTDPLTGVLNRRGFIDAVERELARARRYHHPFVLAYVDVRGLKNVNDTQGHLTGDTLLKNVAALLTESARADDVVGRLGGDELGLLLIEQTPDAAKSVTRRIASEVAARRKKLNIGSHWDLTIGTAAFPQDGQTIDELLGTADRRLYQQRGIELIDSQ